jgi:hypothetical protein
MAAGQLVLALPINWSRNVLVHFNNQLLKIETIRFMKKAMNVSTRKAVEMFPK